MFVNVASSVLNIRVTWRVILTVLRFTGSLSIAFENARFLKRFFSHSAFQDVCVCRAFWACEKMMLTTLEYYARMV